MTFLALDVGNTRLKWAVHEAAARAGTIEVIPKSTKAEGQAQEGDVDGVERGVAAHAFAAAHAPRQRKANQTRQIQGQGQHVQNAEAQIRSIDQPTESLIGGAIPVQHTPTAREKTHQRYRTGN